MLVGQRHQPLMMDTWDGVGWCGARRPPALPSAWVSWVCVAGGCYDAVGKRRAPLACHCGPCRAGKSYRVLHGGPEGGPCFELFALVIIPASPCMPTTAIPLVLPPRRDG